MIETVTKNKEICITESLRKDKKILSFKELVDKLDDWRTYGFVKKMNEIKEFQEKFKAQTE